MIVWLSPFHVPRRSGTAVCARAAFAAIKPVRVTIIASFDIAFLLMWRTSRHLSGHAFGGCIARAQTVSRRSRRGQAPAACRRDSGMECVISIQSPFRGARHGSQYPSGLHRLSVSKVRGRRASRLTENAQPTRSHGATQVRDGSRPESTQGVLRPRVWRLVGAMSELSKAGQCSIANDVEPLQTRD
jgi:hypothetical protein